MKVKKSILVAVAVLSIIGGSPLLMATTQGGNGGGYESSEPSEVCEEVKHFVADFDFEAFRHTLEFQLPEALQGLEREIVQEFISNWKFVELSVKAFVEGIKWEDKVVPTPFDNAFFDELGDPYALLFLKYLHVNMLVASSHKSQMQDYKEESEEYGVPIEEIIEVDHKGEDIKRRKEVGQFELLRQLYKDGPFSDLFSSEQYAFIEDILGKTSLLFEWSVQDESEQENEVDEVDLASPSADEIVSQFERLLSELGNGGKRALDALQRMEQALEAIYDKKFHAREAVDYVTIQVVEFMLNEVAEQVHAFAMSDKTEFTFNVFDMLYDVTLSLSKFIKAFLPRDKFLPSLFEKVWHTLELRDGKVRVPVGTVMPETISAFHYSEERRYLSDLFYKRVGDLCSKSVAYERMSS